MTADQVVVAIVGLFVGIVGTIIGSRLLDYMRGKETVFALQRDKMTLEQENESLRKELADYQRAEQDRVASENHAKDHGRSRNEVEILKMLGTRRGKSVDEIAKQLGISEELAIKHLIDLCRDNCVRSPNFMPVDETWDFEPSYSAWYIRQAGRDYLAKNHLLA